MCALNAALRLMAISTAAGRAANMDALRQCALSDDMSLDPRSSGLWFIQPDMVVDVPTRLSFTMRTLRPIRRIQLEECRRHNITLDEMIGPRRSRRIARPRMIAMARCVDELPHFTLPEIGRAFGGRDHTTVMHAHKKYGRGNHGAP